MPNPGDHARWYASTKKWNLLRRNIMVEGDQDVRYLELASDLYKQATNKSLIGSDLSIISAGTGSNGGTDGIFEEYPPLVKIIGADCDSNGKAQFRVVALADNDGAGRTLARAMLAQYRNMRFARDIFLLHRFLPRTTSEPSVLERQIADANAAWKGLDCEMEDLLGANLLDAFCTENEGALARPTHEISGHRHFEFTGAAKGRLVLFVREHAILEDVSNIVALLKSLRFYLGLTPDGI